MSAVELTTLQENIKNLNFTSELLDSITSEQLIEVFNSIEDKSFVFNDFENKNTYFMKVIDLELIDYADHLIQDRNIQKTLSARNQMQQNALLLALSKNNPSSNYNNLISDILTITVTNPQIIDGEYKNFFDLLKESNFSNKRIYLNELRKMFKCVDRKLLEDKQQEISQLQQIILQLQQELNQLLSPQLGQPQLGQPQLGQPQPGPPQPEPPQQASHDIFHNFQDYDSEDQDISLISGPNYSGSISGTQVGNPQSVTGTLRGGTKKIYNLFKKLN
ncbi:MAG: hypothetical protein CMF62_03055 [Magnetococcales bacterium]|nr:hypothetical protein [Magnetococcales bacterium]|tara:strand:- start:22838 stop:23665 length:828 start_codon:yes stop_codon:yes gene_type:complete